MARCPLGNSPVDNLSPSEGPARRVGGGQEAEFPGGTSEGFQAGAWRTGNWGRADEGQKESFPPAGEQNMGEEEGEG